MKQKTMPVVLNWFFSQVYFSSASVTAYWIQVKKMYTATFLYELCSATVNENEWLNKHSETGLFLENPLLFKVFVGRSVTSRSSSITGTKCYSRNKIPVKICCPVSFSTYLEMTTDTGHFAQKPSATGASAVAPLPYWYWREETTHALR